MYPRHLRAFAMFLSIQKQRVINFKKKQVLSVRSISPEREQTICGPNVK